MTNELAYCLGFLAADGWVGRTSLGFALKRSDRKSVEYIASIIEKIINQPLMIKDYDAKCNDKYYPASRFICYNTYLVSAVSNFGIVQGKSYIDINYLENIPDNYHRAFIYGYFDGDGGLSFNPDKNFCSLAITGRKKFLEIIKDETKASWVISQVRDTDTYCMSIQSYVGIKPFIEGYIELSKTINVLERKLQKAKQLYKYILDKEATKRISDQIININKICPICGNSKQPDSILCIECYTQNRTKHIPDADVLQEELKDKTFEDLAKVYNVSGKTISNWAKIRGVYERRITNHNPDELNILKAFINTFSVKDTAELTDTPDWKVRNILTKHFNDTYKTLLLNNNNNIIVMDSFGNYYKSVTLAAKQIGNDKLHGHILACVQGKRRSAGGRMWFPVTLDEYKTFMINNPNASEEAVAFNKMLKIVQEYENI